MSFAGYTWCGDCESFAPYAHTCVKTMRMRLAIAADHKIRQLAPIIGPGFVELACDVIADWRRKAIQDQGVWGDLQGRWWIDGPIVPQGPYETCETALTMYVTDTRTPKRRPVRIYGGGGPGAQTGTSTPNVSKADLGRYIGEAAPGISVYLRGDNIILVQGGDTMYLYVENVKAVQELLSKALSPG